MDKKHEDVQTVAQIDRTSVFQEGTLDSHLYVHLSIPPPAHFEFMEGIEMG